MTRSILFVCAHGAAKSVLAAAYFQERVDQLGWPYQAVSAGAKPDAVLNLAVVARLRTEGLPIPDHPPRLVTDTDLLSAFRVVSLGCALRGRAGPDRAVHAWDDVPALSDDFEAARRAIRVHVEQLVSDLAQSVG